jgi:hypothetical protein
MNPKWIVQNQRWELNQGFAQFSEAFRARPSASGKAVAPAQSHYAVIAPDKLVDDFRGAPQLRGQGYFESLRTAEGARQAFIASAVSWGYPIQDNNVSVRPINQLSGPLGNQLVLRTLSLKAALEDPATREAEAAQRQFGLITACYESRYGVTAPRAESVSPEPLSFADAERLAGQSGYPEKYRIVPFEVADESLSLRYGDIEPGYNAPQNELERFMTAGGDIDQLAVSTFQEQIAEDEGPV